MDRRTFSQLLAGALTATALPAPLRAKSVLGEQQAFMAALIEKPWLLGYLGVPQTELHGSVNIVSGKVPNDLKGYFLRNGPALHNIGPDRFLHWFDAPGMVQKFAFADGQVRHHGRVINTYRNRTEAEAGRITFSAFGTHGHGLPSGGSADGQSTANTSLFEHAGELLALWEGGSPHIIDPETLDTNGRKSWSAETKGLPFGAHPRLDRDESMWNVGYSADPAALILYHISATGALLTTQIMPQQATPMVHDFMITDTRIVIVAPPYVSTGGADAAFIDRFAWQGGDAVSRILIIDKNDLSNVDVIEVDPFWVFHFGNAYDISPSEIGFDFVQHDDPAFMTKDAFAVMDGSWDGTASAASHYVSARLDLSAGKLNLEQAPELGQVEFIQTDARQDLGAHRYALVLAQPRGPQAFGFNRLVLIDRLSGATEHFDTAETEILEEHLIVPKPGSADDFWIIGTSLDWLNARTGLSIYEGPNLGGGPIFKAELDVALPLGLHGTFLAEA